MYLINLYTQGNEWENNEKIIGDLNVVEYYQNLVEKTENGDTSIGLYAEMVYSSIKDIKDLNHVELEKIMKVLSKESYKVIEEIIKNEIIDKG